MSTHALSGSMASSCQVVFARIKLARSLRELATRAAAGMVVEDQPGRHKLPEQGIERRCDCREPLGGAPGGPLPGGALERPRRCSALEPERPGHGACASKNEEHR